MLDTEVRISEDDLAERARELADLLNSLPLPPLRPATFTSSRPQDAHSERRAGTRATR